MQDFYRILPQRFVPCKKHAKSSYFRDYREMFNWFIPFELWGCITEHIKSETWKVPAWRSLLKPARDRLKFCPQDFLDSQWGLMQREILQTPLNFAKWLIYNWNIWKSNPTALFPLVQRVVLWVGWRQRQDTAKEEQGWGWAWEGKLSPPNCFSTCSPFLKEEPSQIWSTSLLMSYSQVV